MTVTVTAIWAPIAATLVLALIASWPIAGRDDWHARAIAKAFVCAGLAGMAWLLYGAYRLGAAT